MGTSRKFAGADGEAEMPGTSRKLKASLGRAPKVVDVGEKDENDKTGKMRKRRAGSKMGRQLNWRNVTPDAGSLSLLVGSEEGGFLSLEEIDGDSWLEISQPEGAAEEIVSTAAVSTSKTKRRKQNLDTFAKQNSVEITKSLEDVKKTSGSSSAPISNRKTSKSVTPSDDKNFVVPTPGSFFSVGGGASVFEDGHDREDGDVAGMRIVRSNGEKQMPTKTVGKKLKKEMKKKSGSNPKQNLSARERNSTNLLDASTAVDDSVMKEAAPQHEGLLRGERNAKGKKPKLGSRARRLLRGKKSNEGTETKVVHRNEPVEVPADVLGEEFFDMSGWAEMRLHPKLEKAICDLKFKEPTPIQRLCIPAAAHKGKDVIGAAETGSGKTLAFGLPILQRLLEEQDKAASKILPSDDAEVKAEDSSNSRRNQGGPIRALIISPTRELALQICEHLKAAAKWTGIRVVPIVGGMATQKQERLLKLRPEIVVGTPGRLWELMSGGDTHLLELHWLSFFVLDEADRMVERGHFKELQSIIDMLPTTQHKISGEDASNAGLEGDPAFKGSVDISKPRKRRQALVFSATLALPTEFKSKLKRGQLPNVALKNVDSVAALSNRAGVRSDAAIVDLTSSTIVAERLSESVVECRAEEKDEYLYYVLKVHGGERTIVFCTSIAALRRASAVLRLLQIKVYPLHAQMQQRARLKAMDQFRKNKDCVLVATDVAARGLDVPGVRTVVHYQLPHSAEIYVHRSGRTARGSSGGISIALVCPSDRGKYLTLCRALSRPDGLQPFPVNMTYLPAIKKRVSLAAQVDKLIRKESLSKATETWLAQNAEAMEIDMEVSEDEGSHHTSGKQNKKGVSTQLRALQNEMNMMLSQPLKPKAFSNRYVTGSGMSSLITKQLQDCYVLNSKTGGSGGLAMSDKQLVIGQEQMEPLEALRLAATTPRKRKYK